MLTLGLVWVKISAGAGYAIRRSRLRRRLGRLGEVWEVGSERSNLLQPPEPPQPPLANLHQPPSSEAERHRRERDDKEQHRCPCERAPRRWQRPLRVEDRRVSEAAARQQQHEPAPDVPPNPQRAERDHQQPETESGALVPPG